MSAKPTTAQRKVLLNLLAGRPPFCHISGMSAHGGAVRTDVAMRERGWITYDRELTPVGKELAQSIQDKKELFSKREL